MTAQVRAYQTIPMHVEAIKWGPTWADMKVAALWLGSCGVPFRFTAIPGLRPDVTDGLPPLFLFDHNWDAHEVRIGWYLVKFGQRDVRPYPPGTFEKELKEIA
ncbi:hypothetical protein [Nocardia sp. NPDC057440]|uniref:hypothetical protein n=1 Tax=Nocardia sp. NPDC057440 TaxID=3346134 RepID=UPI00366F718E